MLITKFGYNSEFIDRLFADLDEVLKAYIDLVKFLATSLPQRKILVRPHPFESETPYRKAFAHLANVEVNGTGAVGDWIMRSKVLIHYECSTAIEAAFAGVPNLSLAQYRELRPMEHIHTVTDYRESFADVLKAVEEIFNGQYQQDSHRAAALKKIESDIFYKVDGQAYQRISQSILESLAQEKSVNSLYVAKEFLKLGIRNILKFLRRGYLVPEGKKLDLKSAQEIQDRLFLVTGHKCSIKKPLGSSSLLIERSV